MKWFIERPKLVTIAKRRKQVARWPSFCLLAALLAGCGRLSLGSYGTETGDPAAGNDPGDPLGGAGRYSAGGHGNASGGAGQFNSTAGAHEAGGSPAPGGAGNGMVQGGSAGMGAQSGRAGTGGQAGEGGSAGESGGGGAWTGRPSCRGLPITCAKSGDDDCCTSIEVPKGQFVLGAASMEPAHATVSEFSLDKYEVTVGRFRNFLAHYDDWRASHQPAPGAGANPRVPGSGWQSAWDSELAPSASELEARIIDCEGLPFSALRVAERTGEQRVAMNCVNWYEASAFCAWDGARLPTELEWEYAAAGGDRIWPYPWGTLEPSPAYANYGCYFSLSPEQYDPAQPPCDFVAGFWPFGAGRWGHLDLAGSMAEWVFDGPRSYPSLCNDCADTSAGSARVVRGGSWSSFPDWMRTSVRMSMEATRRNFFEGLRCALSQGAACAASCDPNADCTGTGDQATCTCRGGFVGDGHTCARPSSCAELHRARPELASGRYVLAANDAKPPTEFLASCEMSVHGGGWTMALNQDETFDPTTFGESSCFSGGCTSLAYSRVPLESDLLLDFNTGPIVADQFSARALISGVQPAARGKTMRDLFTTGRFFIEREDNANVLVSIPSQLPCRESLPSDLADLLCQTCATGESCTAPVLVFGDDDSGCATESSLRFAIGGAYSYSEPWDNCAGWPQEPDYGGGNYYPKNVRIWVR